MEYVMVPVPEEHLAEVNQFLKWGLVTLPTIEGWDQDAIARFLGELEEPSRSFLLLVAKASAEFTVLTIQDAGEASGRSVHEVLGMVVTLNEAIRAAGGPPIALAIDAQVDSPELGPSGWSLNMVAEVAAAFLDAVGVRRDTTA
jgi:hypothetical protein